MANSKIVFGGEVLIDLTADTIKAEKLLKGYTAHGADGEPVVGTCDYDANTQDATATASEMLLGSTAWNKGVKIVGEMPNNGAVNGNITEKSAAYTVPYGFHDGSGKVQISTEEQAKLIPSNIKQGVTILGVVGTHEGGSAVTVQSKTVTPTVNQQTILPDDGYDYLSQVFVNAIPYVESDNSAGGKTITIG